nr:MAG TPA: hypothetical protein [Crassvirales sp.]
MTNIFIIMIFFYKSITINIKLNNIIFIFFSFSINSKVIFKLSNFIISNIKFRSFHIKFYLNEH